MYFSAFQFPSARWQRMVDVTSPTLLGPDTAKQGGHMKPPAEDTHSFPAGFRGGDCRGRAFPAVQSSAHSQTSQSTGAINQIRAGNLGAE